MDIDSNAEPVTQTAKRKRGANATAAAAAPALGPKKRAKSRAANDDISQAVVSSAAAAAAADTTEGSGPAAASAGNGLTHEHGGEEAGNESDGGYGDYFALHGNGVKATQHTLSELTLPSEAEQKAIMRRSPLRNAAAIARLEAHHETQFRKWSQQLSAGFNLLFYGFGSKKHLLHSFAKQWIRDGPVVVINGYFPAVSLKQILTKVTTDIFGHSGAFRDIVAQISFIGKVLSAESSPYRRLYFIIHNIDGKVLRKESVQTSLSLLAALPEVRMLATIDHILAPLMWDFGRLSRFRWLWHDVTTYRRYAAELTYDAPIVGTGKASRARGIHYVLQSLTPNHRNILAALARKQLEESAFSGLDFNEFLSICQDAMLVTSDVSFRAHLREMEDHDLVRIQRTGGRVYYSIPYSSEIIRTEVLGEKTGDNETSE